MRGHEGRRAFRRRERSVVRSSLERIERSEPFGRSQIDGHDEHGDDGECGGQGMLPAVPWCASTACPMNRAELPSAYGTMKSPRVSEKAKMDPATPPANASGRITH